jgi:hypothetical protein
MGDPLPQKDRFGSARRERSYQQQEQQGKGKRKETGQEGLFYLLGRWTECEGANEDDEDRQSNQNRSCDLAMPQHILIINPFDAGDNRNRELLHNRSTSSISSHRARRLA